MNVSKVLDIETLSVVINKHLVKENLHYNEIVYQIAKLMVSFLFKKNNSIFLSINLWFYILKGERI